MFGKQDCMCSMQHFDNSDDVIIKVLVYLVHRSKHVFRYFMVQYRSNQESTLQDQEYGAFELAFLKLGLSMS